MKIENKEEYLEKLTALLRECFEAEDTHAVLVIGKDRTRVMGLYAINADQHEVGALITAAASYVIEDAEQERTVQ